MKKKYIISILILVFLSIFSFNFLASYIQNKLISMINSDRLEKYIIIRVDDLLERLSEGKLNEEQINYYSNLFIKIEKKYKPIIENLKKKTNH